MREVKRENILSGKGLFLAFILFSTSLLPLFFRINTWPLVTYPMFSYGFTRDSIWGFVPILVNEKTAEKYQVHLTLRRSGWMALERELKQKNIQGVISIVAAEAQNWPADLVGWNKIKIYKVSYQEGAKDKKMWELLFESSI